MSESEETEQDSVWIVFSHVLLPNGPAHRLVAWLRSNGHEVVLAALPMPGEERFRLELSVRGSSRLEILKDVDKCVPNIRYVVNPAQAFLWARQVRRRYGNSRVFLVGCDPLAFLTGKCALKLAGIKVHSQVVYFVDWSAQRLEGNISARVYRAISRLAMLRADHIKAISVSASDALTTLGDGARMVQVIEVIPNIALAPAHGPIDWFKRELRLVYFGGIRNEHGAQLLPEIAAALQACGLTGCHFDIAGDGPEVSVLKKRLDGLDGVTFHGTIEEASSLMEMAKTARVGLALYDPSYAMFAFNDPLKIKDYLSAGLRVVSTLPTSVDDGVILKAAYTVDSIVAAVKIALLEPPTFQPETHGILLNGDLALRRLVEQVTNGES